MSRVDLVVDCRNKLGEVPLWDVEEQALYWVDIEGKLLQRYRPGSGTIDRWQMPERIGSFALREQGGLIVAFASGIAFYDLKDGAIEWIARPDPNPRNRFNEGKCDRKGRFWAGTMDDSLSDHTAALFRIDPDLSVHRMIDNVGISNCFVWSLANDRFYFADTLDKRIYRFAYDHEKGALGDREIFADTAAENVGPDGGTIDAEGFIWNTHWDGWKVVRYAPDGRIDRVVELPIQKPTSCMFGGPDLGTLYVTSAIWDLTPDMLKDQPGAGGVFAIDAGVRGVPEPRFAG
ncbi:SMP-30/gluconolactonase/LRE family protein [Taklimakanibacter deserti]|uniref:SMP-30/gluconolactonase/LRE family protein n=1 Tax=Taklimakanibacter deserti TaxID=2267839 RepID=UPI0013C41B14